MIKLFISTVIPAVGRSTISRSVESVLSQSFTVDDFEIIVVNDSGWLLPRFGWQESKRVHLIDTNQRERSVARNTGAAIARGRYLHFLDDDDWIALGAWQNLWELAQISEAAWLYGSSQLVDRQYQPLIQLHHKLNGNSFIHVLAGEWIPLQSSIIKADSFFAVGGFNPLISGPEDIDLLRRIALNYEIAETQKIIAHIIRGEEGSTTNYECHPKQSRWAREKILDSSGVFSRMRKSATSNYWCGRIVRAYLTSMVWNLQHKHLFIAASRAMFGVIGFVLAGLYLLTPRFWQAIIKPYASEAFDKEVK